MDDLHRNTASLPGESAPDATPEMRDVLRAWDVPPAQPDPLWVAAMLHGVEAGQGEPRVQRSSLLPSGTWRIAWTVVQAQVQMIGVGLWAATVIILGIGLLTLLMVRPDGGSEWQVAAMIPLIILAPVAAVIGAAFVFTEEDARLLELLSAQPIPPSVVFLARLLLVFGLNVLGAILVSLLLAWIGVSLLPLIFSWLLPMTFLTALTFTLSVWLRNGMFSLAVGFGLWSATVLAYWPQNMANSVQPVTAWASPVLPALLTPTVQFTLVVASLGFALFTLYALDRESSRKEGYGVE